VDLAGSTRLLTEHPDVQSAAVFPDDGSLVAFVVPRRADLRPTELDTYVRDLLSWRPALMAPHRYVMVAAAPADPGDQPAWADQEPAADNTEPTIPTTASSLREKALWDALTATHPAVSPSMTATYPELGGEFLAIPAVLDHVRRTGYDGLDIADFLGTVSLRGMAAKLKSVVRAESR